MSSDGGVIGTLFSKRGHQPSGNHGIQLQFAAVGGAHRGGHVIGIGVLQQVPRCAGLERGMHALLLGEGGERHDFDVVVQSADLTGRLDPVDRSHLEVHDDNVRQ